jgi:hypothetical protein
MKRRRDQKRVQVIKTSHPNLLQTAVDWFRCYDFNIEHNPLFREEVCLRMPVLFVGHGSPINAMGNALEPSVQLAIPNLPLLYALALQSKLSFNRKGLPF